MTIQVPLYNRSSDITGFNECEMKWWLNHLYAEDRPDAVWFFLGTAIHHGIEQAILENLSQEDATFEALVEYQRLRMESKRAGRELLESPSKRSRRSIDTAEDDIRRMIGKWFDNVHPDGKDRIDYFNDLEWPPIKVEHTINVVDPATGIPLNTQVDTVFQHAIHDYVRPIVDWKSGATSGNAKDLQLWTYQYGGRLEGWIDERQEYPGFFVHLDFGKLQHVSAYPGDEVMAQWMRQTTARKEATLNGFPLPYKDWWCNYCPARPHCPQEGEGSWESLTDKLDQVEWVEFPTVRESE